MPSLKVTESIEIDVEFEVLCDNCGKGICHQSRVGQVTNGLGYPYVSVWPCEKCLEKAKEDAFHEGCDSRDGEVKYLKDEIEFLKDQIVSLERNE